MAEYLIQDTTLDAIADAINAKTGGSSAMTPAEMATNIAAIPTGGGSTNKEYDLLQYVQGGIMTGTYRNDEVTSLRSYRFQQEQHLTRLEFPNLTSMFFGIQICSGCIALESFFAPKLIDLGAREFENCRAMTSFDLRGRTTGSIGGWCFLGCSTLTTLVLRQSNNPISIGQDAFMNTPFDTGKSGGTIYIPKALYDHLGDGTSLDYKAATNWSRYDGYGTITWAAIEGSIYETQYADGTPILTT